MKLQWQVIAAIKAIFEFGLSLPAVKIDDATDPSLDFERAQFDVIPTIDFLLEDISSRIGLDYDDLVRDMAAAAEAGFFCHAYRLAPLSREQEEACADIKSRYKDFAGERGWRLSDRSAISFVRQFPLHLRDGAIELALSGLMLSRTELTKGIWATIKPLTERGGALSLCRFSPNSGNLVGMLFEQDAYDELEGQGHKFCRNLTDLNDLLEVEPSRTVVFLDDQFSTGSQAKAQLYHWAGRAKETWPPELRNERNIDFTKIGSHVTAALQKGKVTIAFVYGTQTGAEAIMSTAKSLGFAGVTILHDKALPSHAQGIPQPLRDFLFDVGKQVLSRSRGASPEEAAADALGYGGAGSMVVTPFNAPSHAITAFWCPGIFNGLPWVPLFLRRGYRKHLVIG
jgi:hypothetical protein